jgi:(2R)-sulfolactate sulfo-lyase subunit alpha
MRPKFLLHHAGDTVGVAIQDISPGTDVPGRVQSSNEEIQIDVLDQVPLGHKVALRDVVSGDEIIKYGVVIGLATNDIKTGQHVHVHNLKGQRWA